VSKSPSQDAWAEAWAERYPEAPKPKPTRRSRLRKRYGKGPWILASMIALGVLFVPTFAIAQSGNGPQTITSNSSRYTLTARNSGNGGATAQTCSTSPGQPACLNQVNFGTNYAATFRTTGPNAVYLQTSGSGQATPIVLSPNATGEVQYLNADMVGGLQESQLFANYQQVSSSSSSATKGQGQSVSATVTCPTGTKLVSQSGAVNQTGSSSDGQALLQGVAPTSSTQATVTAVVTGPNSQNSQATFTVTAYAVCAQV
jgi:hypothetical protein